MKYHRHLHLHHHFQHSDHHPDLNHHQYLETSPIHFQGLSQSNRYRFAIWFINWWFHWSHFHYGHFFPGCIHHFDWHFQISFFYLFVFTSYPRDSCLHNHPWPYWFHSIYVQCTFPFLFFVFGFRWFSIIWFFSAEFLFLPITTSSISDHET